MKSSTLVTVDLLFHELLHYVQNSLSRHLFAMLSDIRMNVGLKLQYEEANIKINFRHSFHELFSFVQNSFSRLDFLLIIKCTAINIGLPIWICWVGGPVLLNTPIYFATFSGGL